MTVAFAKRVTVTFILKQWENGVANKQNKPRVPGISDPELLRPRVLKYLVELVEETPPLGERHEELLKELIFEA